MSVSYRGVVAFVSALEPLLNRSFVEVHLRASAEVRPGHSVCLHVGEDLCPQARIIILLLSGGVLRSGVV
eukprot:COSAG03_NODE_9399_length_722_cov_105.300161_2_plen_69_part_01